MALPPPSADRTCVVTGASSGIGAEIARRLAERGHGVTLVARRQDRLEALSVELADAFGVRTEVLPADLSDPSSRAGIARELDRLGLEVGVLVNNAGVGTTGPVHTGDREAEVRSIRVDVEAVVDLCSTFVPRMAARGSGAVLNVASTAAFQPLPGQASYAAAKAFVLSYSQAVAAELDGSGVTVTVLCPGPVDTEFATTAGLTDEEAGAALPRFMWLPAAKVAAAGVDGLAEGRPVVVPGWANKVTSVGGHFAPKRVLLPLLARRHPALRRRPAEPTPADR